MLSRNKRTEFNKTGPSVNQFSTNQSLETGESLTSKNKCFRLELKRSGLLSLYRLFDGFVLWTIGFAGQNASQLVVRCQFHQQPRMLAQILGYTNMSYAKILNRILLVE